jgi:hypothetical protein
VIACELSLGSIPIIEAKIPAPLGSVHPLLLPLCCHPVQQGHILLVERDDLQVSGNSLLGNRLWENDTSSIHLVRDKYGGDSRIVFLGDL